MSGDILLHLNPEHGSSQGTRRNFRTIRKALMGDIPLGPFHVASYIDMDEIATPSDPPANTLRMWAEAAGGFGQIHFRNSSGLDYQMARDNIHTVRNNTGATITQGSWVYITGSTGVFPTVALAKADSPTTTPAAGIVVADIANNSFGQMMTMGDVQGVDTSAFSDGDVLYLSAATAGAATATEPTGTNIDQRLGVVVKSSAGAGIIAVLIGGEFDPTRTQTLTNKTKIGIGTASPSVALHVEDAGAIVLVKSTTAGQEAQLRLQTTSRLWLVKNSSTDTFVIRDATAAVDRFAIDPTGRVGIGTASPNASAALDITSTTGALLLPRMTTTQRNALTAANGMVIYNTTTATIQGFQGGTWVSL